FGREPEGCWLAETAVDNETLEVLAEAGLRFTILAPHQAWRVRPLGAEAWDEVNDRVDPSRAYRWRGPRGLELALFFYHAPIARGIAFENLLERSEHLVAWLYAAFADTPDRPQLVHCATDGESYGHHRRFGEMALAAAVRQIEAEGSVALTNYGAFLAAHPPTDEGESHERTSWSCAHGVERWRCDCGCRTPSDWQQGWRATRRYASLALPYLAALGGGRLEPGFVRRLEAAPGTIPTIRDGGEVYRRLIRPTAVDLRRVIAHYAITGLFDEHPSEARIYASRVARLDESREASDDTALRIARVRVSALATGETREMMYA